MCENSNVPFTIIKEKNEGATENQYKWEKTLLPTGSLSYKIENITLVQEPTEKLNLNVTLGQAMSKCQTELRAECLECGVQKFQSRISGILCPFCIPVESNEEFSYGRYEMFNSLEANCISTNKDSISYDLKIDFHNYSHEFSTSYSYEVMCRLPRVDIPDAYLFLCAERRLEKTLIFKTSYASTVCGSEFKISSDTNLYFGVRRIDNRKSEINKDRNTSLSLYGMSSFLNSLYSSDHDCKVILQMKDGPVTAHKSVLSYYSDVFKATFAHEMKEKQEGVVEISDFNSSVVRKMVDYLYTGKLGNITEIVQDLFKLAHRYQFHELCRHCEEYCIINFNIDNDHIIDILELVDLYELKKLKISAEKFVQRYEQNFCRLPSYQKYMCQSLNIDKVVNYLTLAEKYSMKDVKTGALDFIKTHYFKMAESEDFLKLFETNPRLMKEIFLNSSKQNA